MAMKLMFLAFAFMLVVTSLVEAQSDISPMMAPEYPPMAPEYPSMAPEYPPVMPMPRPHIPLHCAVGCVAYCRLKPNNTSKRTCQRICSYCCQQCDCIPMPGKPKTCGVWASVTSPHGQHICP